MGGSLAQALAARGTRVLGADRDAATLKAAVATGTLTSLPDNLAGLEEADIVVLATPVDVICASLAEVARCAGPAAVITDVGSTKAAVLEAAARAGVAHRFVGGHPLVGSHRSGWDASHADLYSGATVFVSPGSTTEHRALQQVCTLWESLGATCRTVSASEHDRRMAWVSHLPQVVASAAGAAIGAAGYSANDLGRGGQDVTRLAASDVGMWTAVARTNREHLTEAIRALVAKLEALDEALTRDDLDRIVAFFREGRDWRE